MTNQSNNWVAVIVALVGLVGVILTAVLAFNSGQLAATNRIIEATVTAESRITVMPTIDATATEQQSGNAESSPERTEVPKAPAPDPTPTDSVFETVRFPVDASVPKNGTGIYLASGDRVAIQYLEGQWTGQKSVAGLSMGCAWSSPDPQTNHVWPLPPEEWGDSLIGYIGSEPFGIGCQGIELEAFTSGELFLGMNDCQNCFWDNDGIIYVLIDIDKN